MISSFWDSFVNDVDNVNEGATKQKMRSSLYFEKAQN